MLNTTIQFHMSEHIKEDIKYLHTKYVEAVLKSDNASDEEEEYWRADSFYRSLFSRICDHFGPLRVTYEMHVHSLLLTGLAKHNGDILEFANSDPDTFCTLFI